ncbi:MAG: hypothetical protein ABH851_09025 [Methanobacteriota archaeon]
MAREIRKKHASSVIDRIASVEFLTNGSQRLLVAHPRNSGNHLVYELERLEDYGCEFYGRRKFEASLKKDLPLSEQEFGLIGFSVDLSGRMSNPLAGDGRLVSNLGVKTITLPYPIFSLQGEYSGGNLKKLITGFSPEQGIIPYAAISTSALAFGGAGDDLYQKTLIYTTGGYGILAEIDAVAGRADEDCCSHEYTYKIHKIRLDETCPIKLIPANEVVSGALIADWTVTATPEITSPANVRHDAPQQDIQKLDESIRKLHEIFRP